MRTACLNRHPGRPAFAAGLGLLLTVQFLAAQGYGNGSQGALAPVTDVTLDTTANGGVFQFTTVTVPAGVTVHLVGANPARILCQGAVTIAGTLEADGQGSRWVGGSFVNGQAGGPGGHDGGPWLQDGFGPGGGRAGNGLYPAIHGGSASHATVGATSNPFIQTAPTYGSVLPFELQGGSGGGGAGSGNMSSFGPPASGGGGAVAILAGGPLTVSGTVRARGGDIVFGAEYWFNTPPGTGGCGSGGAILLRSLQCVRVSGTVDASGGAEVVLTVSRTQLGGDGFVRVDGYTSCGVPNLSGATIHPAPSVVPLPFLTDLGPARIGQVYRVRAASAPGDVFGYYYSFGTSVLFVPPFGVLELDPTLILFLGLYTVPSAGDDPLAVIDILVPNIPSLVGVTVHSQVFNAFGTITGQARISNRLATTVGS